MIRLLNLVRSIGIFSLVIASFIGAASSAWAQRDYLTPDEMPPKQTLHIYLLMGQENMVGRGVIDEADTEPHPRVIMLNDARQWIPAADPLHRRNPKRDGIGPGFTFAKYLAETDEDISIGLIPCAVEGSSLKRWEEGEELYNNAVSRAKEAMQYGVLKGVIWHHGEWDARQRAKAATYGIRLGDMIRNLRRDLGEPRLPFIVGRLGTFVRPDRLPHSAMVNDALESIPNEIPFTGCVFTDGLRRRDLETFNAASARELGVRYAKIMLDIQSEVQHAVERADEIRQQRDFISR